MTITFTESDWDELWVNAQSPASPAQIDRFETLEYLPDCLGSGYSRSFDLAGGMWLSLSDWHCDREFVVRVPDHGHPIQITIFLSGILDAEGAHPTLGGKRGYFSGSGISPGYAERTYSSQRMTMVNIEIEPELLEPLFGDDTQLRSILCRGSEWKNSFYQTDLERALSRGGAENVPPSQGVGAFSHADRFGENRSIFACYTPAIAIGYDREVTPCQGNFNRSI
jgi:hypothetical protein